MRVAQKRLAVQGLRLSMEGRGGGLCVRAPHERRCSRVQRHYQAVVEPKQHVTSARQHRLRDNRGASGRTVQQRLQHDKPDNNARSQTEMQQ